MLTLLKQHLSSPGQYLNDSYRLSVFQIAVRGQGNQKFYWGGGGGRIFLTRRGEPVGV